MCGVQGKGILRDDMKGLLGYLCSVPNVSVSTCVSFSLLSHSSCLFILHFSHLLRVRFPPFLPLFFIPSSVHPSLPCPHLLSFLIFPSPLSSSFLFPLLLSHLPLPSFPFSLLSPFISSPPSLLALHLELIARRRIFTTYWIFCLLLYLKTVTIQATLSNCSVMKED